MFRKIRIITILTILFYNYTFFGQNQNGNLKGNWIKVKVENVNSNFHFNKNTYINKTFFSLNFIDDRKLRISFSPYDIGDEINYIINDGKLSYNTQILKIKYLTDSLLILEEISESDDIQLQPKRFYYHNQEYLLRDLNLIKNLEIKNDSLIISPTNTSGFGSLSFSNCKHLNTANNYMPMPKFNYNNLDFERYLQDNINILPKKKLKNTSTFSFTIDEYGKVTNINIISGENEKLNKAIHRVIKSTRSKWIPSLYDGKSRNSNMLFDFRLIAPSSLFDNKSIEYFEEGNKQYQLGNLNDAIKNYSKAISIKKGYVDAYYNRAAIYLELNQVNKACEDWKTIYDLGELNTYYFMVEYCDFK